MPTPVPSIDPYSSTLYADYQKLIADFGLERFDVKLFPSPNAPMRRGIVFAGRDLATIAKTIKAKKPFYVLTGIMPSSEKIHLGTKTVIDQVKYFQEQGATTYVLVADLEAMATRGISLQEAKERALSFHIPAYLALGLDPKKTIFYFQSENKAVLQLAYQFSQKVTLNEYRAIYGSAEPARIMSALTQAGDILFPQLAMRMPGIIPVGIDQDPHLRLCRDIVHRSKAMKFIPPTSIYHQFTPSLNGNIKMSKSEPLGNIDLPEDSQTITKKIQKAVTGGRATLEEHRRLGAEIDKCMVFALLRHHFVEDDQELEAIAKAYKAGQMTSGQIKELAIEKINTFMSEFSKKLQAARSIVSTLTFVTFN
ncbi:MAG: tryptophan--tRNA ligase [Candidatus Woesearchaeota archaeon]